MIGKINNLIVKGKLREALRATDQAIKENGSFYLFHDKKAEILIGLEDCEGAVRSLRKAIELRPDLEYLKARLEVLKPKNFRTEIGPPPVMMGQEAPRRFCGIYERYPDKTGGRKLEGGTRLTTRRCASTVGYPLVTIVTVVFNNPQSLSACIESVLIQDYPNIEYIIIDGGSDDPTLNVLRKYEDQIDYFLSEPDVGIYSAMNKGIKLSSGEYICLLNSDDSYDPTFVSKSVALALEKSSMLVFTDYVHGTEPVVCREVNSGLFFGHLNINHGTFLVKRSCYDLIGPYSEDYKIISDAVWMRSALKKNVRFDQVHEPLLFFSADGLSSGGTAQRRELFISEVANSYRMQFGHLSSKDAEEIYLFRFNATRLRRVLEIVNGYPENTGFKDALANYVEHCFRDRPNFRLSIGHSKDLFPLFLEACETLMIAKSSVRMETRHGCFSDFIRTIDERILLRKKKARRTILHFITVFSAPSETFVYDLLLRLEEKTEFDNFVLYEHELLPESRPFAKKYRVPWEGMEPEIRDTLYRYLIEGLSPDLIIGHFALNSWKIAERIRPLGLSVPILSMTHGIDVFSLAAEGAYRNFVLNDLARREDTRFTSVSEFLKDKLIGFGVPAEKVDLVSNTINSRFFKNRKTVGFRSDGDPVKIVAIGRMIDWKGHSDLIQAISIVKSRSPVDVSLTLVYANGDQLLADIEDQVSDLQLSDSVQLIPFVDFSETPDFLSSFDLFVHPSTYSKDDLERTETFGMAVLEAIAAGLPVVVTDAGGVPEVVGLENRFARVVRNGDFNALAIGILETINDPLSFADNLGYAEQRLETFSERRQIVGLTRSIYKTRGVRIRAAMFSTSNRQGAGYAAYRIHRGLMTSELVTSKFHTTNREVESEPGVRFVPHPTMKPECWGALQNSSISKPNLTIFTINHPTILNSRLAEMVADFDVISIHWTARFLSIENIAYLTSLDKPVVMTIRDMFPITGGCHFFHGCENWLTNCEDCPQLVDHWDNYPAKALQAKRDNYNFKNLTLVALSEHTAAILRRAPYFKDCRIEVIPNSIETDIFRPYDQRESREALGLPIDRKIVAYVPSYSSEIKGYREAVESLALLEALEPGLDPLVLLIGNKTPATDDIHFEKHVLGYVHDNEMLAKAYSAADVVIVPSLEETFSNTTAEAISCGTPVVGFRTGAIPEMVTDGQTGFCLEVGDVLGFAEGILASLSDPSMSAKCRDYAQENLKFELQARAYEELFLELLGNRDLTHPAAVNRKWYSFPKLSTTTFKLSTDS